MPRRRANGKGYKRKANHRQFSPLNFSVLFIIPHSYNLRSSVRVPERVKASETPRPVRSRSIRKVGKGLRQSVESLKSLAEITSESVVPQIKSAFGKVLAKARSTESLLNLSRESEQEKTVVQVSPKSQVFNRLKTGFQNKLDSFLKPKDQKSGSGSSSSKESSVTLSNTSLVPVRVAPSRPPRARDTQQANQRVSQVDILGDFDPISPISWDQPIASTRVTFHLGESTLIPEREGKADSKETAILGEVTPVKVTDNRLSTESAIRSGLRNTCERLKQALDSDSEYETAKIEQSYRDTPISKPTQKSLFSRVKGFPSTFATSTPKVKEIFIEEEPVKTIMDIPLKELDPAVVAAIPDYNGEGDESFVDYIDRFQRYCDSYGLNRVKMLKLLPLKLKNRAERVYLEVEDPGLNFYETIQLMADKLNTKESVMKAKFNLSVPMQETESLSQYAQKVRRNHLAANPDLTEESQQRSMVDVFIQGLPKQLKWKVMKEVPKTLDQALCKAEQIKTFHELSSGDNGLQKHVTDAVTEAIKTLQMGNNQLVEAVNFLGRNHEDNHFRGRNQNFQRGRNEPRGKSFHDRNRDSASTRKCYNCHLYGHYARDCRRPRREDDDSSDDSRSGGNDRVERDNDFSGNHYHETSNNDYSRDRYGGNSRSVRFSNPSVNTLMLTIALMAMAVPAMAADVFHRCDSRETAALMLVPDESILPCRSNFDNSRSIVTKAVVYKKDRVVPPIPAYSCSVIQNTVCISAVAGIFNLTLNATSWEKFLPLEECVKLERTKDSQYGKLIQEREGVWKTEIPKLPNFPLYGTKCTNITSMLLQYGQVFELRKGIAVSTVGNLQGCSLEQGSCLSQNRSVIWEAPKETNECSGVVGHFDVIVNDRIILLPGLNKALIPLSHEMNRDECTKRNMLKLSEFTQLTFPFFPAATSLYDITGKSRGKSEPAKVALPTNSITPTTSTSMRSYTSDPYLNVNMDTELDMYDVNRVYIDICEARKQMNIDSRLEMQSNPTKAIQKVLGRFDIKAEKVSDSIFSISLCDEIYPDLVRENRRALEGSGTSCWSRLPIVVNGTDLFVDEETMHVYDNSSTVPCSTVEGKQKRAETALKMRTIRAQQMPVTPLNSGVDANTVPIIGFMQSSDTLEEFKNVSVSLWEKVKHTVNDIKDRGVTAAKEGSSKLVNFGVEIKEAVQAFTVKWLTFIRNLLLGILASVVVGAILFVLVKYWLWSEIKSCGLGLVGRNLLRRSVSEPRVNYIMRKRESTTIDPHARLSLLVQADKVEAEVEEGKYGGRDRRLIPLSNSLSICICLLAIAVLPVVTAKDTNGTMFNCLFGRLF